MAKVLIIDDDSEMCDMLVSMVSNMGHNADFALSKKEGVEKASSINYDVVLLDVRLPDGSGLDILPYIRQTSSSPEVIVMTGYGDPDGVEIAINNGAWDYLQKPLSPKKIILPLSRVLKHKEKQQTETLKNLDPLRTGILGKSLKINEAYKLLERASGSKANVLITGPTGTGKDLFARAIHENSDRGDGRFIIVDCASLPETLVESVLFGHEKGSFTGAEQKREGLIKLADKGTLFLDEIGELPLSMQKTFLRVLQDGRFRAVGGKEELSSDFRLICATNRDLETMAEDGSFREDLLYRIKAIILNLPSLADRKQDIRDISLYHIEKISERNNRPLKECSSEFLQMLEMYDWPGNVRELVNSLENACAASGDEDTLLGIHLPTHIRIKSAQSSINHGKPALSEAETDQLSVERMPTLRNLMHKTESDYIKQLITLTDGNIKMCCAISGLSRSRMYAILKKHNIKRTYNYSSSHLSPQG